MQLYFLAHVKHVKLSTEYGLTSPSRHYRSFRRSRSMAQQNQNKQQTWV